MHFFIILSGVGAGFLIAAQVGPFGSTTSGTFLGTRLSTLWVTRIDRTSAFIFLLFALGLLYRAVTL